MKFLQKVVVVVKMKKNNHEKYLIYLLIGLFIYVAFDKTFQTILDYFYGEGKKYATDASKEAIRKYTDIIITSISFLIGYFVKGKIDNATLKQQSKIDEEENNKCESCGQDVKYE